MMGSEEMNGVENPVIQCASCFATCAGWSEKTNPSAWVPCDARLPITLWFCPDCLTRIASKLQEFDTCPHCSSKTTAWLPMSYPSWARRGDVESLTWELFCHACGSAFTLIEVVAAQPVASFGDKMRAYFV